MSDDNLLGLLMILLFIFGGLLVEASLHCQKNFLFWFNRRKRDRRKIDLLAGGRRGTDATLILPKLDASKYYIPKKTIYKLNYDGTLRLR